MSNEKPSSNKIVLREIMAVKDLEKVLREENETFRDSRSYLGSDKELTDEENERFARGYTGFLNSYVDEIIAGRLKRVYNEHGLKGTPEGEYIQALIRDITEEPTIDVYDMHIKNLNLPTRACNGLFCDNIKYVGQLVQKTRNELLRTPNFGRKSLEYVEKELSKRGLSLEMDIGQYTPPEQREK